MSKRAYRQVQPCFDSPQWPICLDKSHTQYGLIDNELTIRDYRETRKAHIVVPSAACKFIADLYPECVKAHWCIEQSSLGGWQLVLVIVTPKTKYYVCLWRYGARRLPGFAL